MFVEDMLGLLLRKSNPIYFIVIEEANRCFSELYLEDIARVLLGKVIKVNNLKAINHLVLLNDLFTESSI